MAGHDYSLVEPQFYRSSSTTGRKIGRPRYWAYGIRNTYKVDLNRYGCQGVGGATGGVQVEACITPTGSSSDDIRRKMCLFDAQISIASLSLLTWRVPVALLGGADHTLIIYYLRPRNISFNFRHPDDLFAVHVHPVHKHR